MPTPTSPLSLLLQPEIAALLEARTRTVHLPAGAKAFRSGDACEAYLWVTEGVVRVQMVMESGRERVLYRVGAGDSCVLTTSCLFGHEPYAAEGVCETAVAAVAIPVAVFRDMLGRSQTFRDLVLSDYSRRVGDLLLMIDLSASRQVPTRLAEYLLAAGAHGPVAVTHQTLAVELGTAREVISRALKDFERRGLVKLGRGEVTVVDRSALSRIADL